MTKLEFAEIVSALCKRPAACTLHGTLPDKLAKIRSSEPLAEAVDHAAAAGRKYIAAAGDIPNGIARVNGSANGNGGTKP